MSGWLEVFIVLATVAIIIQSAILVAMFIELRAALERFNKIASELQSRMGPILLRVNRILDDSEDRIHSIMSDASEITRVARGQAQKVDRVLSEAMERLRTQITRVDQIITGTLEVVEETGSKFRRTVWGPMQQASAIIKGIKTGLDVMRGHQQRRPASAEPVTQDEELFI